MCNIKNRIKIVINIIYGILMVVVVAIPLYLCVINSFKQNQSMFLDFFCIPETFDLSNFRYIFIKKHILRYMFNSFYITTIVVGIISIINPFIAYKISINWDNKKYRAIYFCISSAMFIPSQFIIFPLIRIFYKLNLMNPIGLIVYYSIFMIPECVFMLVPFFKFFKKNLRDAAYLDGSNELSFYFRVFLPTCKSVIVAVTILSVIWVWNDFFMPLMILNKDPSTWTLPIFIYNFTGKFSNSKNYAFATAQIATIPLFIFYSIFHESIFSGFSNMRLNKNKQRKR